MEIRDPKTGYAVSVNEQGRMTTEAVSQYRIGYLSDFSGKAFSVYGRLNLTLTATDQYPLFITSNSSQQLHIASFTCSTNGTSSKIECHLNGTRTSGGTLRTPLNLNRYSGNQADLTVYDGTAADLICAVPASQAGEIVDVRLSINGLSTFTYEFKDSLSLKKNDTVTFVASGTTGDVIRIALQCYFEDVRSE